jgi:hypothetical protein
MRKQKGNAHVRVTSKGRSMKAIETKYRGFRFRSRLEARWAVFMDAAQVRWEYEPEGFETSAGRYLPDFRLPEFHSWLEIKPSTELDEDEAAKMIAFAKEEQLYVLCGQPWVGEYEVLTAEKRWLEKEWLLAGFKSRPDTRWGQCPLCGRVQVTSISCTSCDPVFSQGIYCAPCDQRMDSEAGWASVGEFHKGDAMCAEPFPFRTPRLSEAYAAARSARFEFGESGHG